MVMKVNLSPTILINMSRQELSIDIRLFLAVPIKITILCSFPFPDLPYLEPVKVFFSVAVGSFQHSKGPSATTTF